tara:strand:- start:297 stop:1055 length:759 start_codon:yes stop_codon:yes gene_type:complete
MMTNKYWNKKINNNFNIAAHSYSSYSFVQKYFANKLLIIIKELEPQIGEWIDLGAGTGYLADLLEKNFTNTNVIRIDLSPKMLKENKKNSQTILWDLNLNLPPYIDKASLIISSFCIHWLNEPEKKLRKWYDKLAPGGFLIVLFPNNESFPEWKDTCEKNNVEYSGLSLPCTKTLKRFIKENEIFLIKEFNYTETFPNIYKLFKSIINVGAHSTQSKRKTISELKLMQEKWPKDPFQKVNLTWSVSVLILKK